MPPVRPQPGTRANSLRAPSSRSTRTRENSAAPSSHTRIRSGAASPAESIASSRPRSPLGMKRKDRDFEAEMAQETNINVVVRCRGRNNREVKENSGVVVRTEGAHGNSVELSMGASSMSNKTYHFDKVFSLAADQVMLYEETVAPILEEMMSGFNCTIFAYGQTGTGKTYTMSGDMTEEMGLLSDEAGIIPRVLCSLFRKLEADGTESTVKCSFIELYNEELRDLIAREDNAKLKIFEDGQKKGHSGTVVQGMEESHIKNASEGIKLLQDGSHKRQVAATKCNDLSSRSHTVFTITLLTKRTTDGGDDWVSAGKLNLVDLAGSENIGRSGAENKRAAEAGLINKSLLTLGRVINALVDKGSHIPYRESKLTRLLQDSLGGRTKTCIIATISPARSNLEETISTLDYAFRAKNIRNKPQINQPINKKTLLNEFTAEIEKLKSELIVTRQRNGVYLSNEAYEEMKVESESRRNLSEEQSAKIETMEVHLKNKVQELFMVSSSFSTLKKNNEHTKQRLEEASEVLQKTEIVLADSKRNLEDERLLRKAHQATEEELSAKGGELITTLGKTVKDVDGLHSKLRRRSNLQTLNRTNFQSTQSDVSEITQLVESRVGDFQEDQRKLVENLLDHIHGFVNQELDHAVSRQKSLHDSSSMFKTMETSVTEHSSTSQHELNEVLEEIKVLRDDVKDKVGHGLQGLSTAAGKISEGVISELETFHTQLHNSYSTLGKDFKTLFEDLVTRVNTQRTEAENLRIELAEASAKAAKQEEEFSTKLETCMEEERKHAAADRVELLSQITNLVNANGVAQEKRMSSKLNSVRSDMASSRATFKEAETKYTSAMEKWSESGSELVNQVQQSKDSLKVKLQNDWTQVGERHASIQNTTKSVHAETVRIVDFQVQEVATQMQTLDDFVTRARSQNDSHHSAQAQTFQSLVDSVTASFTSSRSALDSTSERIRSIEEALTQHASSLSSSLPSLQESLCDPLTELRASVTNSSLQEYTATGETPQKTQYVYPHSLPRTGPHEQLLGRAAAPLGPDLPDISEGPPSPSKASVYADSGADSRRPATSDGGLRELDAAAARNASNIASGSITVPLDVELGNAKTFGFSASMGPPPLKRHATDRERRKPRDREREMPLSASVGSTGRRLRSSPGN